MTPVFVDLLVLALKEKCKINFSDYCYKNNKDILCVSREKFEKLNPRLLQYLDKQWDGGAKMNLGSPLLIKILEKECADVTLVKTANEIRNVEEFARNTAAHEIVSIDDEWLMKRTNFNSKQIMKLLRDFTHLGCTGIKADVWKSYDEMNKVIIAMLK